MASAALLADRAAGSPTGWSGHKEAEEAEGDAAWLLWDAMILATALDAYHNTHLRRLGMRPLNELICRRCKSRCYGAPLLSRTAHELWLSSWFLIESEQRAVFKQSKHACINAACDHTHLHSPYSSY